MGLNFIDQTAQILFSDLLKRSEDLTDAKVRTIAETAFRRALMLDDARKSFVPVKEDKLDWEEYTVKEKEVRYEKEAVDNFEEEEKEEEPVKTKLRKVAQKVEKVPEDVPPLPAKKRGRPKGSGKKKIV